MRIEDLKVGDRVRYKIDETLYIAHVIEIWNNKIRVKNILAFCPSFAEGISWIRKDQIVSKLEPITEYKEIPIDKPKNFIVDYGNYDVWPRSRTVSFPFPEGCDFTKKYTIEIKEKQ